MRYEAMRTLVTGEVLGPSPVQGLALFFRRGLAGWMQAWPSQRSVPTLSRQEKKSERRAKNNGIISLLLEMAIQVERGPANYAKC
jgi:hypothetical protein